MKIQYGKQLTKDDLINLSFDLFLLGGNHEDRVLTFYDNIKENIIIKKSIMFRFKDDFEPTHGKFDLITIRDCEEIYSILDKIFTMNTSECFNLLVDYSCMTKPWYYSIILYLSKKNLNKTKVQVVFTYTPSMYSDPLSPKSNSEIAPLPGKYVIPTDKPKALIVCLGYEKNKAEGIIEHLDPKYCHIFYTKPTLDPRFASKIEENNKDVIDERKANITTYAFDDLLELERSLSNLYQILKNEYSIIIAPLGPKPFALVSMIMAAKYPDIDIWRVGSGNDINEYDRPALNENTFIINNVMFFN